ncbi:hypothetical protein OG604_38200 [Streptomyces sp. NBC_01231]|nr:hypothetical protein OG604_38200 [Streptomyces sp. NBC_01231]
MMVSPQAPVAAFGPVVAHTVAAGVTVAGQVVGLKGLADLPIVVRDPFVEGVELVSEVADELGVSPSPSASTTTAR